ncbi:hypothetical protein CPB83DRAFT_41883 [Crepidotus variabilis]|uniref:Transmembrane protein n=1 Tax=Crepidotus variabilis TaxID=179855 RepID=A0A9P6ENH2_9AGAR|nr:hypothetical protein CPB83DRAFT_41883 [Crepidotus variabilis]
MLKNPPYPSAFVLYTQGQIFGGCLAVAIWDVLCHLLEDFQIVFLQQFTWKTAVFLVTRLTPIAYFVTVLMRTALTQVNCDAVQPIFRVLLVVFRSSTTLLLLLRVDAIYRDNRPLRALFLSLWLLTLGAFIYLSARGMVTLSNHCLVAIEPVVALPGLCLEILNDTLICLAILYKLGGESWKERGRSLRNLLRPRGSSLSEVVVQDTLIFAGIAIFANVCTFISCLGVVPLPEELDIGFGLLHPGALLVNMIALRIYRNMKLGEPGLISSAPTTGSLRISNLVFNVPVSNSDIVAASEVSGSMTTGALTRSGSVSFHEGKPLEMEEKGQTTLGV